MQSTLNVIENEPFTSVAIGLIATVGVLLFIKILPETKGKSLEQLENELVKYNA